MYICISKATLFIFYTHKKYNQNGINRVDIGEKPQKIDVTLNSSLLYYYYIFYTYIILLLNY